MKKKMIITNFDLEIGGVERSLIGLLSCINKDEYYVDLFLFNHKGEFFNQIPKNINLLSEIPQFSTFRKSIKQILLEGHLISTVVRLLSKIISKFKEKQIKMPASNSYLVRTIFYSLPLLPKLKGDYDIALSFLTPHYVVSKKVSAKIKVAFIHTDYTLIDVDKEFEIKMWEPFNYIAAVSEECKQAFIKTFPSLQSKCMVIENILSPEFVRQLANIDVSNEMPDDGHIKICSVGRFSPAKGFDQAVLACKKLKDLGYKIKWYVIGYGGDGPLLRQLIAENNLQDYFIILGKKVNPYPYMKACDIYAQPSRYEGKAVTVREAQMLGKPVVITNFTTAKSQLEDGIDGYICPMGVDGIVEGLKKLITDQDFRSKIAQNASLGNYGNEFEVEKIYNLLKH